MQSTQEAVQNTQKTVESTQADMQTTKHEVAATREAVVQVSAGAIQGAPEFGHGAFPFPTQELKALVEESWDTKTDVVFAKEAVIVAKDVIKNGAGFASVEKSQQVQEALVVLGAYVAKFGSRERIEGLEEHVVPSLDAILETTHALLSRHDVGNATVSMMLASDLMALILKAPEEWLSMKDKFDERTRGWEHKIKEHRKIIRRMSGQQRSGNLESILLLRAAELETGVICLPKPGEVWAVGLQVIRLIAGSVNSILKGSLDTSVLNSGAELLNLAVGKARQLLQRDMDKLFKLLAQFSRQFDPNDVSTNRDGIKDDIRCVHWFVPSRLFILFSTSTRTSQSICSHAPTLS